MNLSGFGQIKFNSENTIFNAGLSLSIGTHINNLGFFGRSFSNFGDQIQWNNELRLNYYIRNYGPKKSHPEIQISSGLVFGYGPKREGQNYFMYKNSNYTNHNNTVSYTYNLYFNTIKTSQQTACIGFSFGNFYISHENDLLARPTLDRYRTAGIQIVYQHEQYRFSITQYNWTGMLGKRIKDTLYPSPAGYLDTTANRYGLISNGILCLAAEYSENQFYQQIKVSAGIDAEQIRHWVQNRIVHDGCFLPKNWRNKNNYHFPMIDEKGNQYLFRDNQKIRKPKIYFNTFLNSDLIY